MHAHIPFFLRANFIANLMFRHKFCGLLSDEVMQVVIWWVSRSKNNNKEDGGHPGTSGC